MTHMFQADLPEPLSPKTLPAGDDPKYLRLAAVLQEEYIRPRKTHDLLPTEREIQAVYEVSRDTVRRAIAYLIKKGLVYNQQGSGTYVADQRHIAHTPQLITFTEDMLARGYRPGTQTLHCTLTPADPGIARDLNIPLGTRVLRITRLRLANGAPIAYEKAHFRKEAFATLEPDPTIPLAEQLEKNGYRPITATSRVSATDLTKDEATALQLPTGAAALKVHKVGYTVHGVPIESTETLYRADRYDYTFHLISSTPAQEAKQKPRLPSEGNGASTSSP